MAATDFIAAAITGGLGAAFGAVAAAAVQVLGKRGESRASAADLVTTAAGRMVERLDAENRELREAILLVSDVLDELIHSADLKASPEVLDKLKQARRAASI